MLNIRELNVGGILGPVLSIGNEQQRSRCRDGSNFNIAGLVVFAFMNRQSAFADASAKKMCRYHYHGSRNFDPVVQSSEHECLRTTSRLTRDSNSPGIYMGNS